MPVRSSLSRPAAALAGAVALTLLPGVAAAAVSSTPAGGTPSFDGPVLVVRHVGNTTYVGGAFTHVTTRGSGSVARSGAAAYQNTTGELLPWNPQVAGEVRDIAVVAKKAYVVGDFGAVKGQPRRNVALVRSRGAGKLKAWTANANGRVNAVEIDRKAIYLGGDFSKVGRKARTRLASFTRAGALRTWAPAAQSGQVYDLESKKAGVYVAGEFNALNGRTRDGNLALVTRKNGRTVRAFDPRVDKTVLDIEARKTVYVAAGGSGGGTAWKVHRRTGATKWMKKFDGDVQAITVLDGEVYAAGHFGYLCNTARTEDGNGDCLDGGVARKGGVSLTPGGQLTSWNPQVNSSEGIVTLDPQGSRLVAGGYFTTANNGASPVGRLAAFRR